MGGTPCWGKARSVSKKEWQEKVLWTDHNPQPHPLCQTGRGGGDKRVENEGGMKLRMGRRVLVLPFFLTDLIRE